MKKKDSFCIQILPKERSGEGKEGSRIHGLPVKHLHSRKLNDTYILPHMANFILNSMRTFIFYRLFLNVGAASEAIGLEGGLDEGEEREQICLYSS